MNISLFCMKHFPKIKLSIIPFQMKSIFFMIFHYYSSGVVVWMTGWEVFSGCDAKTMRNIFILFFQNYVSFRNIIFYDLQYLIFWNLYRLH